MSAPYGFSWIDEPHLAALAQPSSLEDLQWLRGHGIQVLVSLGEDPPRRDWVNESGLMVFHEPVPDFEAPTQEQIDRCLSAISKANAQGMGVAVHCAAGKGRTGTILACWFVSRGLSAREALARVRSLRPGSVETSSQEEAIREFARRRNAS
jgi:atypical dual specificity phosphatase